MKRRVQLTTNCSRVRHLTSAHSVQGQHHRRSVGAQNSRVFQACSVVSASISRSARETKREGRAVSPVLVSPTPGENGVPVWISCGNAATDVDTL